MKNITNAYDVAKKAGVSQSTVSRVLNNYPYMKESTRQKVLNAIEELNFTRDEIARSLSKKKTNTIGLIIGDITNNFYAESSRMIMEKASHKGYDVIIGYTDYQDQNLEKIIQMMIGKRVDGILIASAERNNQRIGELNRSGFPVVLYNALLDEADHSNFVVIDNEKGGYLATKHLISLGHRNIGFISGPSSFLNLDKRYHGYLKALKESGIDYYPKNVYRKNLDFKELRAFAERLLEQKNRPTAVFATSDQIALEVMDAAIEKKINIPEDLSVIGFDDIDIASNRLINLSTISQNMEEMTSLALDKLLDIIKNGEVDSYLHRIVAPELKVRKTTGPVNIKTVEKENKNNEQNHTRRNDESSSQT